MSLFKRKDSSFFWIKISINGRTIQESTGTADRLKALEFHDRRKVELWEQAKLGAKPRHCWKEAVVRWIRETSDKKSHRDDLVKLRWLHDHLGNMMLDQITSQVIANIKEARLQVASKSTANRYLALVRSILIRARDEWEWVDKVPKVKLFKEPPGRVRFITREQAERLLCELPVHQRDIVLFALHTGLRQGNVMTLAWSQVDMARAHMWVEAEDSKNGASIGTPLNAEAMAILGRQIGKHPERVFTYRGDPISNLNTRAWRSALKRAGIEDFRWHDLRHTWASWHRMAGTHTHELRQLGAWKTMAMVERYAHLAPDHLAAAAERLEAVRIQ